MNGLLPFMLGRLNLNDADLEVLMKKLALIEETLLRIQERKQKG